MRVGCPSKSILLYLTSCIIQHNLLGQTEAPRCESSPPFQGVTLSPSSGCYHSTENMATGSLPEMVENIYILRRLPAREDCFEFCRRESFKTWTCIIFTEDCNVLPVSYSSRSFLQPSVPLFFLLRNIPFSTLYTNTLNFYTSIYRISTWNEETLMLSFLLWLLWLLVTVIIIIIIIIIGKGKDHPAQAEVAQGVPSRLRSRISLTFGTTRVVGRQPYAPAAFIPGEIPGTHFQRLSRPQGVWFRRWEPRLLLVLKLIMSLAVPLFQRTPSWRAQRQLYVCRCHSVMHQPR